MAIQIPTRPLRPSTLQRTVAIAYIMGEGLGSDGSHEHEGTCKRSFELRYQLSSLRVLLLSLLLTPQFFGSSRAASTLPAEAHRRAVNSFSFSFRLHQPFGSLSIQQAGCCPFAGLPVPLLKSPSSSGVGNGQPKPRLVFLLGAQKGGTTSLFQLLTLHPAVVPWGNKSPAAGSENGDNLTDAASTLQVYLNAYVLSMSVLNLTLVLASISKSVCVRSRSCFYFGIGLEICVYVRVCTTLGPGLGPYLFYCTRHTFGCVLA